MRKQYSRLASVEEKRNIQRAVILGILTILFFVFLFFLGLPTLVKFAGFFVNLGKSSKPIEKTDTIPPAPPRFNPFEEFTNKTSVEIIGTSEPGATIKITFNNNEKEILADKDGKFSLNFDLNKGENIFFALAEDMSGNKSQKTQEYKIIFDKDNPKIDISSPANNAQFYGSKQRQIEIKGSTEIGADININDRLVSVEDDGSFVFSTTLNEGTNEFKIKATDKAGNTQETTLTVTFSS